MLTSVCSVILAIGLVLLSALYRFFSVGDFAGGRLDPQLLERFNYMVWLVMAYVIVMVLIWRQPLVWRWLLVGAACLAWLALAL